MIRKTDIIIISLIIVSCLVLALILYSKPFEGDPVVNVYINGEKFDSLPLNEDADIDIETPYGFNQLVIQDGVAKINEANCNTKSCMSEGVISRPGSMIICAPHHLVVKVETTDQGNNQ